MRFRVFIALLILSTPVFAQVDVAPLTDQQPIPRRSDSTLRIHTAIQPQVRQLHERSSGEKVFANPGYHLAFLPVPDFAAQVDSQFFYRAAAGMAVEATANKFYVRGSLASGWSSREGINQTHPGILPLHNRKNYIYTDARLRVAYTPNRMLHLAAGVDNQFFGEGYRSVIQGDQVAPNPFALMRVNFWRLEYGLLYQLLHTNVGSERVGKFSATHYLSYNVTRKWNIGLIENVLFQAKDTVFRRGFDVEYLNPIVFFRPQEYSLGSSDNILLAIQSSYTFKKQCVYFQAALDEFVLSEIKARSKWWANKYAVQLGVKGDLSAKNSYRFEANVVRPYTYAHFGPGQNVTNLGRPLAHALGGNFAEMLAIWNRKTDLWNWKIYGSFLLKGYDEGGYSWGGDVTLNYVNRPPIITDYGHRIGQGLTVRTVLFGAELTRIWPPLVGRVYINPQISMQWGDKGNAFIPMITAGFRSALFQERKLF